MDYEQNPFKCNTTTLKRIVKGPKTANEATEEKIVEAHKRNLETTTKETEV